MTVYIREDQADIRVTVNGKQFGDTWSTFVGGGLTAADAKTRPGGMGKEKSVGGPASRGDVTCTIQWSDTVASWHNELESYVGRQDIRAKAAVMWLNPDGSVQTGATFTRVGTVKEASMPDSTEAGGDVGFYTLVIACDEVAV